MNKVAIVRSVALPLMAALGFAVAGCRVGPEYTRPSAPLAPAFKEPGPDSFKAEDGWKRAQPRDAQLKGDWWTLFNDPQLDTLEDQVDPANQTLKQAEANFRAARAQIRVNRSAEAPTISTEPSVGVVRESKT